MKELFRKQLEQMKKPALQFEIYPEEDQTSTCETYFGGVPYITEEKELQHCPSCQREMTFVMQISIPNRENFNDKKLYALYYCFECADKGKENVFSVNVYKNPSEENNLKIEKRRAGFQKHEVRFMPIYELPEWDYAEQVFPEFTKILSSTYQEKDEEVYGDLQTKISEYYESTGLKLFGYPEMIDYDELPLCPVTGEKMELFLMLDAIPELELYWIDKKKSTLFVVKSPTEDIFNVCVVDVEELYEDY